MTQPQRNPGLRMDAAILAEQPESVIRLVEFLERVAGIDEYPLADLPAHLRSADVLHVARRKLIIRIVVRSRAAIGTLHETWYTDIWSDYRDAGYPEDTDLAMQKAQLVTDPAKRLHVRLWKDARDACVELRLRNRERPLPADAIKCAIAIKRYHATKRTLYDAIREGRLPAYRAPGAGKNRHYRVSESDVARLWLPRA